MPAVMIQAELEDIGTMIGTDKTLAKADPVIGKMMPGLAEGGVRQTY
jgi:hypothetical protein